MAYAQIHTQAPRHPKLLAVSDAAWRLWATGLCYVQEHMTDGLIPAVALVTFGVAKHQKAADELVAARLWHQDREGYRVHDYGDWNHTREEVAKRQSAKRERWARWKQRQQADAANAPQTRLQTDCERTANASSSLPQPQPQPQPQVQPPQGPPSDLRALWDAWRDVATAKGVKLPCEPTGRELATLEQVGQTYTPDEVRRAAVAFWAKSAKARSLAYFAPQVGELLAPTVLSPEDEWRKGFFHFWTCRECGEVHSTDEREVYQRKPCQKEHGTMSYAEFKARQAAKGAA